MKLNTHSLTIAQAEFLALKQKKASGLLRWNVGQNSESVSSMLPISAWMPEKTEINLLLSLISAGNSSQETQARVNSFKAV